MVTPATVAATTTATTTTIAMLRSTAAAYRERDAFMAELPMRRAPPGRPEHYTPTVRATKLPFVTEELKPYVRLRLTREEAGHFPPAAAIVHQRADCCRFLSGIGTPAESSHWEVIEQMLPHFFGCETVAQAYYEICIEVGASPLHTTILDARLRLARAEVDVRSCQALEQLYPADRRAEAERDWASFVEGEDLNELAQLMRPEQYSRLLESPTGADRYDFFTSLDDRQLFFTATVFYATTSLGTRARALEYMLRHDLLDRQKLLELVPREGETYWRSHGNIHAYTLAPFVADPEHVTQKAQREELRLFCAYVPEMREAMTRHWHAQTGLDLFEGPPSMPPVTAVTEAEALVKEKGREGALERLGEEACCYVCKCLDPDPLRLNDTHDGKPHECVAPCSDCRVQLGTDGPCPFCRTPTSWALLRDLEREARLFAELGDELVTQLRVEPDALRQWRGARRAHRQAVEREAAHVQLAVKAFQRKHAARLRERADIEASKFRPGGLVLLPPSQRALKRPRPPVRRAARSPKRARL